MVLTNIFATFRVTSCLLEQMFRMWHIYYLSHKNWPILLVYARKKRILTYNCHIQIARVAQAFIFKLATQ